MTYHEDLRAINDNLAAALGHLADLRSEYSQAEQGDPAELGERIARLEEWITEREAELATLAQRCRWWPGK